MCNINKKLRKEEFPEYIYKVVRYENGNFYSPYAGVNLLTRRINGEFSSSYEKDDLLYNAVVADNNLITGYLYKKHAIAHANNTRAIENPIIIKIKIDKRSKCFKGDANNIFGNIFPNTKGDFIKASAVTTIGTSIVKKSNIEIVWPNGLKNLNK